MKAKFVVHRTVDNQHMFNLVATNGRIIATSERYKNLRDCINGVNAVVRCAPNAEVCTITPDGQIVPLIHEGILPAKKKK